MPVSDNPQAGPSAPPPQDDLILRAVPALRMMLLSCLIALPVPGVLLPFMGDIDVAMALWGLVAVLGVLYHLLRRGVVKPVFVGLAVALVAYGLVATALYGSVRGTTVYAFVGAVVVSGFFFGRPALVATVLAGMAGIALLIVAERAGWLGAAPDPQVGLLQWVNHAVVLAVIGINVGFAHSLTVAALAEARRELAERRIVERALGRSEELFDAFFRSNPAALVITRVEDGAIVDINAAYEEIFGVGRADFVGRSDASESLWASAGERAAFIAEVAANGRVVNRRVKYRRHSGAPFDAIVSSEALEWRGTRHLFTTITDVSAEAGQNQLLEARVRERTAQLEASNRELEAFSYSVSHDLRSPLRAVDGFIGILEESLGARLQADEQVLMRRISDSCSRMDALIADLLDLSRIGRMTLQRRNMVLSAQVALLLEQLRTRDPQRRVRTSVVPDVEAQCDPALTRIVLENLLGNAWKFTGRTDDALIEFGVDAGAAGATVYFVRDNGAGFDMRYADKLFTAFQRMHRQDEFPGSGIGLVTVQRIVARHGGRVWAEAGIGRGATFRFTLQPEGAAPPPAG